ncbi:hypothetical protein [Nocardioides coralli]|uniref:hypothetical protein n=1 Tax=Nocardioides coralli TaxID=2872154 RepID=UPI001CA3C7B2|nr:hypothetical protein [Nocardioides coralli]QZY28074.1 hypothetical protein K6T13_11285 [Nocardioides coralli]
MPTRVVLVRPWADARGSSGCCAGDSRDPIAVAGRRQQPVEHDHATRVLAAAYGRLRAELPGVDVQVVSASNTAWLVPAVLRAARGDGLRATLRRTNQATRPGSLLVDGRYAGDLVELGPAGVVTAVREHLGSAPV